MESNFLPKSCLFILDSVIKEDFLNIFICDASFIIQ